ncbi:kynurenine 3-monooxygenase [Ahniella affigens]|uniref:Kynurenine 3-monooxygenase n=2 Tax=Ahniella affigens TaxID=2021234 RepID=A0A2P1PSL4_9GAMM|nr:NAD(P)/FAD-dependent oxidoreductase [Ahniella affigens]AVP97812.1 kynurenine 3-monooxygenase [Ahniella affigens]
MSAPILVAGGGLAGALMALLLARRGESVLVLERRPDPRTDGYFGGRSINLALAERGLHALRQAGLEQALLDNAVMMRGRMIHEVGETPYLQRYGKDDSEVIWSVNRGRLNQILLVAAEAAGARILFDQRVEDVNFDDRTLVAVDEKHGSAETFQFSRLIGADGAGSAVRKAMAAVVELGERFEPLGHGYKELEIPAGDNAAFRIERNALHIWPRGGYMLIALPNIDGSFTVTLFLPNAGNPSFATLTSPAAAEAFFQTDFASAISVMPEWKQDFFNNPTGMLGTLRLDRWHLDETAVLIGDAAHAIVPFHGQGMNCAFEDCIALDHLLADADTPFARFQDRRKPNANAIADLALENYVEMRDQVADEQFHRIKQLERRLADAFPTQFVSRYAMVMFHRVDYAVAKYRGAVQLDLMLQWLAQYGEPERVPLDVAHAALCAALPPFAEA